MRTVTTRQSSLELANEELVFLDSIKDDSTKVEHFLNILKAEKLIYELASLRYSNK